MRLKIRDFAKIKQADIVIDGITVIAGENNTGKSTIGKILYSLFNSFYDMDLKIESRREEDIREICNRSVRNTIARDFRSSLSGSSVRAITDKISAELSTALAEADEDMLDEAAYHDLLMQIFAEYDMQLSERSAADIIENSYAKILSRKQYDANKIAVELVQRFFVQVFDTQIQCLRDSQKTAEVTLVMNEKETKIAFRNNQCVGLDCHFNIFQEAFLIDDPFILDNMKEYYYLFSFKSGIKGQLINRLNENRDDIMDGIFDAVRAKDNLKEVYDIFSGVVSGEIAVENGQWVLSTGHGTEAVHFENLSAGSKSFVLLKLLLERGILKEKDVLILDEPEIHLHPEWQLSYAEIIVLLQKKFDLNIVVTTHSRDFLEAIELYEKKYDIYDKSNFYLSYLDKGLSRFENVSGNIEKIYDQLVTPSMLLDKLRYEMETGKDE